MGSSKATPDLTTSINQTVASMILSSLLALSCLISPVFLDNEMVRKKLVRRRKQGWQSEEEGGNDLSPRHISPVKKVFKRKINGNGAQSQKQLVRRKVMPHILPDKHNIDQLISPPNRIFPTTTNQSISPSYTNEAVPTKPMDAKRFLSLFTIVSFKNDPCQSNNGNNGTCLSSKDCEKRGGIRSGTCASGFGVCCIISKTCGGVTNMNGTFFQSPGYPSTFDSVGSCQLTVNKASADVCQLRLDMDNMILAQPESTDNKCSSDQLIVTGGAPVPAICGTNTGQHMYVDMGLSSNNPVVLTVVTAGASFSRTFSVKITQIECTSLAKAADGCLQYYTGVAGRVESFNYNNAAGLQLSDTDYSVCVRMERNFCGIQYTACNDNLTPVTPTNPNQPAASLVPQAFSISGTAGTGSLVGTSCSTDWITIPCATNTNDPFAQNGTPVVCVDRICGQVFNSVTTNNPAAGNVPVYSYAKPFHIYVHTDSVEGSSSPPETLNRGFCLNFVQQPCTSSTG